MFKRLLHILGACVLMAACADNDLRIDTLGTVHPDGSIVTDKAEFTAAPDGFTDLTAAQARSAIAANTSQYLTDTATHVMLTVTNIPPAPMPDNEASRGIPFNSPDKDGYTQFDTTFGQNTGGVRVTGTYVRDGITREWFNNVAFPRNEKGQWRPANDIRIPNGNPQTTKITLYGWTPNYKQSNSLTVSGVGESSVLNYVTPTYGADQTDIMVAKVEASVVHDSNGKPSAGIPTMQFKHIMAGLRVRVATRPGQTRTVNRIDINNVPYKTGAFAIKNGAEGTWSTPTKEYFSIFTTHTEGGANPDTEGDYKQLNDNKLYRHHYNEVMYNYQTFMLIPQTLDENTRITIYWSDGKSTSASLNGVQLKKGFITFVDFQEPSIYVEDFVPSRAYRDKTSSESMWDYLKESKGGPTDGGKVYFRLYDDPNGSYYKTVRPVCWKYNEYNADGVTGIRRVPRTEAEETAAWENNNRRFYGECNQFVIKDHSQDNSKVRYYQPYDLRYDYFIAGTEHKCNYIVAGVVYPREALMNAWGSDPTSGKWNTEYPDNGQWHNMTNASWECLGGEIDIKLIPHIKETVNGRPMYQEKMRENGDTKDGLNGEWGEAIFTPRSTDAHPICYPARLPLTGSVEGWPMITVQPHESQTGYSIKGNQKNINNIRSFRMHYLKSVPDANGYSTGNYTANRIPVMQFAPYDENNKVHFYLYYNGANNGNNWWGQGSLIMFGSSLHGSVGKYDEFMFDEFITRMGVAGRGGVNVTTYMWRGYELNHNSLEFTFNDYTRSFQKTNVWLPSGTYNFAYNINAKKFTGTRIGMVMISGEKNTYNYNESTDAVYDWYEGPYYGKIPYPGAYGENGFSWYNKNLASGVEGYSYGFDHN